MLMCYIVRPFKVGVSRTVLAALLCCSMLCARGADVSFKSLELPPENLSASTAVHPVNVLSGPELELVTVDKGSLTVYALTGDALAPVQRLSLPLPPEPDQHVYYGFARVTSPDIYSLVILSPGSVLYYPVLDGRISATPQTLFATKLINEKSPGATHRHFDMALDFNGDGLDELLLPGDKTFSLYTRDGAENYRALKLPREAYKQEYTFTFNRDIPSDPVRAPFFTSTISSRQGINDLLFFDANTDGKLDLVYSSTTVGPDSKQIERYDVYLQKDALVFSDKPDQSFAVPYDGQADATFRDINQDGRLDAVLVRSNLDIVNPRTVIKFYIGKADGYQIFSRETDRFVTKDPVGLVQLNDFNSDGVTDFAMTFFSYQFGSVEDIVDLAFANKIQFRLQFFLGRAKQGFPKQADAEVPVTLNTKLENFKGSPPVTIVQDMNGDRMMDMIVRNAADEFQVFLSTSNFAIGATAAASFKIPEKAVFSFVDLNQDGLNDIIVSDAEGRYLRLIIPNRK